LHEALSEAKSALSVLVAPPARAWALALLADMHLAAGETELAVQEAGEASSILNHLGTLPEGDADTRYTLALVLRASGRVEESRSAIHAAVDRLIRRSSGIPSPEARRRFLEEVPANAHTVALANEWGVPT
jgi:hypothetical protein